MRMGRSTFYDKGKAQEQQKRDKERLKRIEAVVLGHPGYGSRRVTHELRRQGRRINRKVVERLMRAYGLIVKPRKKFVKTTDSGHPYPVSPNRAKGFVPTGPNQLWVSDITYIRLGRGFVYLAVILDAWSRKAIGFALSERIDTELTLSALRMALLLRNPPAGCIHHSDRGVQYAARDYVDLLKGHGFEISMSRKGNPYDNAKAESLMKTLKYEEVYLSEYGSPEDAAENILRFLDDVYNKKRLHSSLGYVPPNEFESRRQKGGDPAGSVVLCAAG